MRHKVVVLLIGILMSCTSKPESEISEPEKIANSFFRTYATDGPNKAIRQLFSANKYISSQSTDTVAIGLERLSKNLGDYQGYELIGKKSYGKAISYLSYVVKYSRQALRFTFECYNPGDGWRLQNFRYETEFLREFDEAVKPHRLKENLEYEER